MKEYERTFEIFVKYPKKMLSDSVHVSDIVYSVYYVIFLQQLLVCSFLRNTII